jgi:hypothetical protein
VFESAYWYVSWLQGETASNQPVRRSARLKQTSTAENVQSHPTNKKRAVVNAINGIVDTLTDNVEKNEGSKPGKILKTLQDASVSRASSKGTRPHGGPTFAYEKKWWGKGKVRVAGVDEAGRGPLAGPVVAAACVVAEGVEVPGVNDSKQLTEAQREEIYSFLIAHPEVCLWVVTFSLYFQLTSTL